MSTGSGEVKLDNLKCLTVGKEGEEDCTGPKGERYYCSIKGNKRYCTASKKTKEIISVMKTGSGEVKLDNLKCTTVGKNGEETCTGPEVEMYYYCTREGDKRNCEAQ